MKNRRDTRDRKELRKRVRNKEIRKNLDKLEKIDVDLLDTLVKLQEVSKELATYITQEVVLDVLEKVEE